MKTADVCNRIVATIRRDAPLTDAARKMREKHVGSLVVVAPDDPRRPVGILTDRDIVLEVVAAKLDPQTVTVGEVMSDSLITAPEDDNLFATLRTMRREGIRRMPVIDRLGRLVGIVTLDDILHITGSAIESIVGVISHEQAVESRRRRA